MILFDSTKNFRTRLSDLLKAKRGVYANLPDEIKQEFKGADIEKIRNNRDMILIQNEAIIVKLRLPDKKMQLSKANGYRLIYMVSTTKERVVFLDIYPKRGPMQQLDIEAKDLTRLLMDFNLEDENGTLEKYNF